MAPFKQTQSILVIGSCGYIKLCLRPAFFFSVGETNVSAAACTSVGLERFADKNWDGFFVGDDEIAACDHCQRSGLVLGLGAIAPRDLVGCVSFATSSKPMVSVRQVVVIPVVDSKTKKKFRTNRNRVCGISGSHPKVVGRWRHPSVDVNREASKPRQAKTRLGI